MPKTVKVKRRKRIAADTMASREWGVVTLGNGSLGCTCPREACGGKVLVNPNQLAASRRSLGVGYMICPYCEHMTPLPKEVK